MVNPDGTPVGELGTARRCFAITPHASNENTVTRGFMVNVAGNVAVRFVDDTADVTLTLQAGVVYPFRIKYVRVAGTTATGIFGFI